MIKKLLSILLVLLVIYIVPFVIYAVFSAAGLVANPEGSPELFLLGVFVSKIGTALGFVLLYTYTRQSWRGGWLRYALVWWVMFVIGEVGQAITPSYTFWEAVAGILSEAIYFPLSAIIAQKMLRNSSV